MVLDCGVYQDNSGLSERLLNELDDALHFLNDYNLSAHREDRDPTYISKQVLLSLYLMAKSLHSTYIHVLNVCMCTTSMIMWAEILYFKFKRQHYML